MEQVEVEITGMVITQRYGTLNTGDILRTDAAFAKHLVEEACGAKYTKAKPAPTGETPATRTPRAARSTRAARTPANKKAPEPDNKQATESDPQPEPETPPAQPAEEEGAPANPETPPAE